MTSQDNLLSVMGFIKASKYTCEIMELPLERYKNKWASPPIEAL